MSPKVTDPSVTLFTKADNTPLLALYANVEIVVLSIVPLVDVVLSTLSPTL